MGKAGGARRRGRRRCAWPTARLSERKFSGTRLTESEAKNSRASVSSTEMKERGHQFVLCVGNDENPAALELRKIYEATPDPKAAKLNLVRIIDESG